MSDLSQLDLMGTLEYAFTREKQREIDELKSMLTKIREASIKEDWDSVREVVIEAQEKGYLTYHIKYRNLDVTSLYNITRNKTEILASCLP